MRLRRLAKLSLIALFVLPACGGLEDGFALDGAEGEEAVEYGEVTGAATGVYDHRCVLSLDNSAWWEIPVVAYVRVEAERITFSRSQALTDPMIGSRDPNYTRQPTKEQYERFTHPASFFPPSSLTLLKTMRNGTGAFKLGGAGGYINLSYFEDGGPMGYGSYFCKRVPTFGSGNATGGGVTAEGVSWTRAEADGIVKVANEATAAQLRGAGLTTTQANAIIAGRRYTTLGAVAAVSGIGAASLRKMRTLAGTLGWIGSSIPAEPVPATLPPRALQWMAVYSNENTGTLRTLSLRRDGWFMARIGTSRVPEYGIIESVVPGTGSALPVYTLRTEGGAAITARVTDRTGGLSVLRAGETFALRAQYGGETEANCGIYGGTWTGASPNAAGLYCNCPAGTVLIWSTGGCVK